MVRRVGPVVLCLVVIFLTGARGKLEISKCQKALGMQSKDIPDSAITASSTYDADAVGPNNARIRTDDKGGAWCPKLAITSEALEWLEIDLGKLKVITFVETQGRFGNGQGQEFVKEYMLDYKREDNHSWIRFRNRRSEERYHGNTNTYVAEMRKVNPPIIAKRIRFVPYDNQRRTICMRVELYGCPWRDGIVEYNMQQGDNRGHEVDLHDFTYDGEFNQRHLSGGLGQLVDGVEGQTNFRLDPNGFGMKGYEWVGWKNETGLRGPVEITFKFDAVRNFTAVEFHCNNMYSRDVSVFKKAVMHFSIGGIYYQRDPMDYSHWEDTFMEHARPVKIKLNNHIGKYVKVALWFNSRWILISEVSFVSTIATGSHQMEIQSVNTGSVTSGVTSSGKNKPTANKPGGKIQNDIPYVTKALPPDGVEPTKNSTAVNGTKTGGLSANLLPIIIGALAAFIIIIAIIVIIAVIRCRRRKHNNKPVLVENQLTLNLTELHHLNGNSNGVVRGRREEGGQYRRIVMEENTDNEQKEMAYHDPRDVIQSRKLPDVPNVPNGDPYCSDTFSSREYAVPDVTVPMLPAEPAVNPKKTELPPSYEDYYASTDVANIPNIQGVSGNNVYAVSCMDAVNREDIDVMEFPRENLRFVEKLGEGQFGEVHLCESINIAEFLGDDFLINRTDTQSLLVAVKVLLHDAGKLARDDFIKEIKIMSRLQDPNIVRVLGMCSKDEPLCMVVEFMKYGDLNQFLGEHVAENTLTRKSNVKTLGYGCLIYMASQVASGMKYLESQNMVHRDLATRNCLVGHLFTIKISDFGMSRSLYSADYYRIEGMAVLPIRWMAWESILLGKFTTKSDVWSFGVTLWEILTYTKCQPYQQFTDEQVIENCGHFYRNDEQQAYLSQPNNCPKEIYDLMLECWNRTESGRPAFKEIHMFMLRKNVGYNPREEIVLRNRLPVV